jgi:hypothetical protein
LQIEGKELLRKKRGGLLSGDARVRQVLVKTTAVRLGVGFGAAEL